MSRTVERAVTFDCGGARLVGILHPGSAIARSCGVVFVVGGPQYRLGSHRQFVLMARALAQHGFPVFRFDYQGMGDSEGIYRGFEGCSADIRAAVDLFLCECPQVQSVALFGLCDGASAALMYSAMDARIDRLILANPWVRTESTQAGTYLRHYYWKRPFQRSFWTKLSKGEFEIRKSLSAFASSLRLARAPSSAAASNSDSFVARMLAALRAFTGPVLILMSGQDLTAREFADVCEHDKSWRRAMSRDGIARRDLPDADHTFSARASLDEAVQACADWLTQLEPAGAKAVGEPPVHRVA